MLKRHHTPVQAIYPIGRNLRGSDVPDPASVGFKAYNLMRMSAIGLPVPHGFVLGTAYCRAFLNRQLPDLRDLLASQVRRLEAGTGLVFGGERKPLLLSVRSGAPVSMPGMLETVLDVGLNSTTLRGFLRMTGNPRLVWDSWRRLIQSFAEVVHGVSGVEFDRLLTEALAEHRLATSRDLDFHQMKNLAVASLDLYARLVGAPFLQDPIDQLEAATRAVFRSWNSDKAVAYRRINGLADDLGTAVTVQRMVFGNAGGTSGSGVAFTRDPASGENRLYLDFLANAQGEDIVSGRRMLSASDDLASLLPPVYQEIVQVAQQLEREFGDTQEFEFTVQDAKLYLLQTRGCKRTPLAALRMAVEQVAEGLIDPAKALQRLAHLDLDGIESSRLRVGDDTPLLATANSASLGVASGRIALDVEAARRMAQAGESVILVRMEIATDDIAGIDVAAGLLTAYGGRTSHAAVVARERNKVCLVGCAALGIDLTSRRLTLGEHTLTEGDLICLDGESGHVYAGSPSIEQQRPLALLSEVAGWEKAAGKAGASADAE
jgi:pyruvate,orthophosphate dikinase